MVQYRGQLMPLVPRERRACASRARARSRCWCSRTAAARWRWWSTRSSTSSRTGSTSRSRSDNAGRARLGRHQGPGDRNHRHRPLPAARLRGLVPPQGAARRGARPRRCCWSTIPPFFRNMLAPVLKAAGYDVTAVGVGARGAGAAQGRARASTSSSPTSRCPSMDGFELAERAARRSAHRRRADHRAVLAGLGRSDRARPPGRLPRLRRQVRPPGPDRGAQGADRRRSRGVTSKP